MTETIAERLKRLNPTRQWRADNNRVWGVREHDYKILIEQAERAQELEANLNHGAEVAVRTAEKLHYAQKENKRLNSHLEKIRSYMEYDAEIFMSDQERFDGIGEVLKKHYQTLEGDSK